MRKNNMEHFRLIRGWAHERNLVDGSNPNAQTVKLLEEIGEMAGGIARKDRSKIMDGIGDAVVVLTILAEMHGVTIEECIETAWSEIKDRTGKMIDGVFVKQADL